MTQYTKSAARKTSEAKVRQARGFDRSVFETFAREALISGNLPVILPREKIHAVGLFTLAAASLYFESIGVLRSFEEKDSSPLLKDSGEDSALSLTTEVLGHQAQLRAEMKFLSGAKGKDLLTSLMRVTNAVSSGAIERIKRERSTFEIGTDGHPLTREVAANLNIARHFEEISGDFSLLLTRVFAAITHYGVAYGAWERRLPMLICNLERVSHVRAAAELSSLERGGITLLSESIPNAVRAQFSAARETNLTPFIEDKSGVFRNLIGIDASDIFLIERRLGGWSITYPLGGVDPEKLKNRRYPKWARALAACAPSLKEETDLHEKNGNYLRTRRNCEAAGEQVKLGARGKSQDASGGCKSSGEEVGKPPETRDHVKSSESLLSLRCCSPNCGRE